MNTIESQAREILKSIGLDEKVTVEFRYSLRFFNLICGVEVQRDIIKLCFGNEFLSLSYANKERVLKYQIAHIYDIVHNGVYSVKKGVLGDLPFIKPRRDKAFKDLCEKLFGDRTIAQVDIKRTKHKRIQNEKLVIEKDTQSAKVQAMNILKQIGLSTINLKVEYNGRYSRVNASVTRMGDKDFLLQISDLYLKYTPKVQEKILKHEMAHIYDRVVNKRRSRHDKVFRDLCEKLFNDRVIGQATNKNF